MSLTMLLAGNPKKKKNTHTHRGPVSLARFARRTKKKRETARSVLENIPGHSVFAASNIAKGYGMHSREIYIN